MLPVVLAHPKALPVTGFGIVGIEETEIETQLWLLVSHEFSETTQMSPFCAAPLKSTVIEFVP
jgi:hypothetical protein